MALIRQKQVDDAPTDCEISALFDQVCARVTQQGEVSQQVLHGDLLLELDGEDWNFNRGYGLDEGAHRCDDHLRLIKMGQYLDAIGDGIVFRAEFFVWQRLPGRQFHDPIGT